MSKIPDMYRNPNSLRLKLLVVIFLAFASAAAEAQPAGKGTEGAAELIAKAQKVNPEEYQNFIAKGGKIVPTFDGRSFYLFISPQENSPIVVSLHGHAGWAFKDYAAWSLELSRKGFGLLTVQWWFGLGDEAKDYYSPQELYAVIENALRKENLTNRKLLLHGFSRGAANIYGVVALDRYTQNKFFPLIVANSGGASRDFLINRAIDLEQLGSKPFTGTRWILFCGGKDSNPDRDGCEGMARTKEWIEANGGIVELFIQDMTAGHGGFHRNPANVEKALKFFEQFNR